MSDNIPGNRPPVMGEVSIEGDNHVCMTRGVAVLARSFFLADQSEPENDRFVWAYRIRIENRAAGNVKLLRRTWRITDSRGRTQHVHGDGVIGKQPALMPGEAFEYTSGTPLDTPSGIMSGWYHMIDVASGEPFDIVIPAFSLDSPHQSARLN